MNSATAAPSSVPATPPAAARPGRGATAGANGPHRAAFLRRHEVAVFVLASAVAVIPLLFARYFPGLDLPWHAAIAHVLHQHDPAVVQRQFLGYFEVKPQVSSYLLMYYAVDAIAFVVGDVVEAMRVVVALYVIAFLWSARSLLRAYGGDGLYALAALPAAYSITLEYGFITYALTFPITVTSWAVARRIMNEGLRPARGLALAVLAAAISFTHPFAAVVALVGTTLIVATHLGAVPGAARRAALVAAVVGLGFIPAVWAVLTISSDPVNATAMGERSGGVLTQIVEMDRTSVLDSLVLIPLWLFGFMGIGARYFLLAALAIGVVLGRHAGRWPIVDASERGPVLVLGALGIAYLVTPFAFGWPRDWYAAQPRLVPLLFVWLLVVLRARPIDRPRGGLVVVGAASLLSLVLMTVHTFAPHGREGADFRRVAAAGAERARTLALIEMPRVREWLPASPWRHAGSWFFVERGGFVSNLPMSATGLLSPGKLVPVGRAAAAPEIPRSPATGYARTFRWDLQGAGWDQFLIRDGDPAQPFDYFREHADKVALLARAGRWRLYRAIPAAASE